MGWYVHGAAGSEVEREQWLCLLWVCTVSARAAFRQDIARDDV